MTEGIIQKIIEKWFISNLFPNGTLTHELTYTDILILQSRLIEEIKNFANEDMYYLHYEQIIRIKDLIGDTK